VSVIFQQLPKIMLVVISALIAYQTAILTWAFYPQASEAYQWTPPKVSATSNKRVIDTYALQKQALFGQYEGEKALPVAQNLEKVPKTRLKLTLVGIIAVSDPALSSVIIEYKSKQDSYFVDSVITGTQARITEIYNDRIVINVNGEQQILVLDGLDELTASNDHKAQPKRSSRRNRSTSKSKELAVDREALLSNPGKLLDYIRISPVREGEEVKGYRVKPGKKPALFKESGLKSGDLAIALNGVDLTDTSEAVGLMKQFPTMTDISLTIDRDGEIHELSFTVP